MLQIEHDHLGPHYALSLKTINPGVLDGTGIHFVSLLHSVSPRLSLGFETIIQHPQPTILETATSYVAKLTSLPNPLAALTPTAPGQAPASIPFNPSWTATAQLQPSGNVQATYHQRMSDKIDVALDFQTIFQPPSMMGPAKREALCTLGAKYDLRMSCFRAQIDSNGKVGMLLEQRFSPVFAFLVSGEIDHAKVSPVVRFRRTLLTSERVQVRCRNPARVDDDEPRGDDRGGYACPGVKHALQQQCGR